MAMKSSKAAIGLRSNWVETKACTRDPYSVDLSLTLNSPTLNISLYS